MAKLSSINKNKFRESLASKYDNRRKILKNIIAKKDLSFEERIDATLRLAEMPRNSSKTRFRNRCELSGRPRGYHRKFKLSRIALRDLASQGLVPGVTKASW